MNLIDLALGLYLVIFCLLFAIYDEFMIVRGLWKKF